jgi:8-hydroxy-5-deazaflavin:NADPH oxidoreductase
MRIGIIGAGMIGGTLARRLAQLGHQIAIANSRGPETLRGFASEVGATAVSSVDAARGGEIVVIAIPESGVPHLPSDLFAGVPADIVVIDTGNYYPTRDGRILAIEQGQPESAWVADQIGRPVIKAFNNIYFNSLLENGRPKGMPDRIALPVAGDPLEGRAKVLHLVDELGFDPVDAGGIEESWRQQPGTPCYTRDNNAVQLKAALAAAVRSRVPEYRKAADDAAKAFFRTEPGR